MHVCGPTLSVPQKGAVELNVAKSALTALKIGKRHPYLTPSLPYLMRQAVKQYGTALTGLFTHDPIVPIAHFVEQKTLYTDSK